MLPRLFIALSCILLFLCSTISSAPIAERDVFVPPILTPKKGAVWKVSQAQVVTWDVSKRPTKITNNIGTIILAKGGRLLLDKPLADGFDILKGKQTVHLPKDTKPGHDYQIIVFGDSGNSSPVFSIAP